MDIALISPMSQIPTSHPPVTKAEKAAHEFEGILLGSLLDSLQKTFSGTSDQHDAGISTNYSAMGSQALVSAIAARGGIGFAQMILQQWRQTKVPSSG